MKKLISLFLAVLMIVATMPMALAAETLKATNVTKWPTLEYISADGKLHYGQTLGEAIKINDDEIVLDTAGNQVAGHFEFMNASLISTPGTKKANIKFIPDDTTAYSGFNQLFSSLSYVVDSVELVPVNHDTEPLTATEVERGAYLSTSILSGAKYTNPYNEAEPNLSKKSWEWVYPTTKVEESGYYDAIFSPTGYEAITAQVYVRIAGDIPETQIIEMPTLPENLTYDGVTTWDKLELTGGKAVTKGDNKEVAGKFTIDENLNGMLIKPGDFAITVNFTPDDPEAALPYTFKISGTVSKGIVNFVDENGNVIVPEITLDRILEVGSSLNGYLKSYLNKTASFNWEETAGYRELLKPGIHELTVKTICDDPNYERYNYLTVKFNVNKEKVTANVQGIIGHQDIHFANGGLYQLGGDFDITYYIDGEKAGVLEGIKLGEKFAVPTTKSGVYTLDVVYNPAADDMYEVTVTSPDPVNFVLKYKATIEGKSAEYAAGETVTAAAATPSTFVRWNITDTSGNPINVAITSGSLESYSIAFLMPEYDVVLTPEYKSADSGDIDIGIGDIDGIDGFLAWLKNLIEKIKGVFETIIEFFRSIGDMT